MVEKHIQAMRNVQRIHFVGIGGAGMSGIAEVLINQGYNVSGSDICATEVTERLARMGAQIHEGHSASYVEEKDVVVVSTAIDKTNVEVMHASKLRLPVISRAEMLGELMRYRYGIAVAGTHGKTTTTSLITEIFGVSGLDPTFVVGGIVNNLGSNARLGGGNYLIAEADESDASFLKLQPTMVVLTNIDQDHMGTYDQKFSQLCDAFLSFITKLPFYGVAIVCIDDLTIKKVLPQISRSTLTYGFDELADYHATNVQVDGENWQFVVERPNELPDLAVCLPLPGLHNVLNATAAIAIATEENIEDHLITKAIAGFQGVGRRFETHSDIHLGQSKITLIDDYGHHPTEIKCVIDTVRAVWPKKRVLMVYQPHRYSRTRDLYKEFVRALSNVDQLFLLDVYSAGEDPIDGCSAESLSEDIYVNSGLNAVFISDLSTVVLALEEAVEDDDILLIQGAGNVSLISQEILSLSKFNKSERNE